jgi:hypothetical protein
MNVRKIQNWLKGSAKFWHEAHIRNFVERFNDGRSELIPDSLHRFEIAGFRDEKQSFVIQNAIIYYI